MRQWDSNGNMIDVVQVAGSLVTLTTRDEGISDFETGTVTVGAAPIELKAGPTALSGRKQLIVYPPEAGVIYWGKIGVTATAGAPLTSGDSPLTIGFKEGISLSFYAINDGTNRDVKVVETK